MGRKRKYPPGSTSAIRMQTANQLLRNSGGCIKSIRLPPAACAALKRIMKRPDAPAKENMLFTRLLIKEDKAYRSLEKRTVARRRQLTDRRHSSEPIGGKRKGARRTKQRRK